jgi:RNA polymerase sigma factor (sigma-70 family)
MATVEVGTLLRHVQRLAGGHVGQLPDRQLLDDFAAGGDEEAFAELVARHGAMVLRVCRRVLHHEQDVEDAFQAVFLALAQNTRSIHKREALAGWLHGVAYRTAMKARRSAARRRNHEARVRESSSESTTGPSWNEVRTVLDEEIGQLPEVFRAAFVSCVLEGKSGPETAAQLGCKEGTVKSRVNRARQELRRRLANRGIDLAALLAALSVAESSLRASVPAALAHSAIPIGLLVLAGECAGGRIPSQIAALAAGVTRAMFLTKTKIATALLLLGSVLVAGAVAMARPAPAAEEQVAKSEKSEGATEKPKTGVTKESPKPAEAHDKDVIVYGGRVLGPDGKSIAGAKLYLTLSRSYIKRPAPSPVHATTEPDGRFRFTVPKARYGEFGTVVVAVAPGHGPAWLEVGMREAKDKLELRLVKDDVLVNGRVVDLQGRPLSGVTIRVLELLASAKEDLRPWVAAARAKREGSYDLQRQYLPRQLRCQEIPGLPKMTTTDVDGRFRLTGIGRERVAALQIEGPIIATRQVRALTREGEIIEVPEWKPTGEPGPTRPPVTYYPATFIHAAAPTKPIVGVVRDRDTNKPLAGFTVRSYKLANNPLHGIDFIQTMTDVQGRYRLTGMPKGKDNKILVVPPDDQPYVTVQAVVPDTAALDPVTVEFALMRGVWIEGKITNKATGKPVGRWAQLSYYSMDDNPNLRDYPGFAHAHFGSDPSGYRVKEDGSYRIVGLPGPGLLALQYSDHYLLAHERDDPEGTKEVFLATAPFAVAAISYNALTPVNPPRGAESFRRAITLAPGLTFKGTVLGPDGKPLSGALGFGMSGWSGWDRHEMKGSEFTLRGFNPRRPRDILFLHLEKGLVGVARPPKKKGDSVTVRMQPGATVTGRLLDADGQARAGVELELSFRPKGSLHLHRYFPERIKTDREGRFRIAALLPGYEFSLYDDKGYLHFGGALRSGQTEHLGDVQMKRGGE